MAPDPVEIHEYSTEWPGQFKRIAGLLRTSLSDVALRIDHIGSTAVPGMAAKPIIDIQVSVVSLDPIEPFLKPLESAGWVWDRDNTELTKHFFREPPGFPRIHLHVRRLGSWHEQLALLFRDYLRQHPADCAQYEQIKRVAAITHRDDRAKYGDAKTPIIWEIIQKADRWAGTTGWEPSSSDA